MSAVIWLLLPCLSLLSVVFAANGFVPPIKDDLHRLRSYTRDGQTTTFNYDNIGNITLNQEMGAGQYVYGGTRPHAVTGANGRGYGYDEAGNMTSRNGQSLVYTSRVDCAKWTAFITTSWPS